MPEPINKKISIYIGPNENNKNKIWLPFKIKIPKPLLLGNENFNFDELSENDYVDIYLSSMGTGEYMIKRLQTIELPVGQERSDVIHCFIQRDDELLAARDPGRPWISRVDSNRYIRCDADEIPPAPVNN